MHVLAFDTASSELALAFAALENGRITAIESHDEPAPRKANQALLPRAEELLSQAGAQPHDIDVVVVGRGPGSFTGVRIGVATAKGIACGLGVALHGVSTLDAVAWHAWRGGVRGAVGVVEDAMRKEIYPVRYLLDDEGVRRLERDRVAKPADVAEAWTAAGERLTLVGDGLKKHAECFESELFSIADEELWTPDGRGLVEAYLAAQAIGGLDSGAPEDLLPVYTRLSDAEENERARLGLTTEQLAKSGVAEQRAAGGLFLHPMSINDVPEVAELQQRALPEDAWNEGKLFDEIGRYDRSWWVARKDGACVGCAGGQVVDGELCILIVCVDPAERRQGIATRLLERVATDARALAAETITLEVRTDNIGAQALYHRLGLSDVGVRPHYYKGRDDALIMRGALPLAIDAKTGAGGIRVTHPDTPVGASSASEHPGPLILAIESSCDETAASIIDGKRSVLSDVIASQIDFHARFGGVVPEIASRKHIEAIVPTVMCTLEDAGVSWRDLSAIAVTQGPGLVGALVVGLAFAKGAAFATGLPLICVNHLEGHLYANRYVDPGIQPPFVALLVSGGHTMLVHVRDWGSYEVLGSTLDDAVGEAFDKVAKALGLGYPGGPIISRYAASGDPKAIRFPRAMMNSGDYKFSLSGLKTAVITYIKQQNDAGMTVDIPDLAASFQAAVVDVLVAKSLAACEQTGARTLCIGGGVAANPALRSSLSDKLGREGIKVVMPELADCTDNASMIASVALDLYREGEFSELDADPLAHMPLRDEG
ncbi:MAG: tRNA (adenosine(37)-N6)-threonylcarbamoyltransferase complex transferase subunit TsaD [Coriobacteriales bacterium]|jgi:N6-L-threonylcarbamoyladenine synthase/protein kinase Bud32